MTDRAWPTAPKFPARITVETVIENVNPEIAALLTGFPANRFTPPITEIPAEIAALPEEEQGRALVQAIHDRKEAAR